MLKKIKHIGIVVKSIDDSLTVFRDLMGLEVDRIEELSGGRFRIAFLRLGEVELELIEPRDCSSMTGMFLDTHGEGIHHICVEVDDIDTELEALKTKGVRLIDKESRPGASGTRIAFIDPLSTSGVLFELSEGCG